VAKTDFLAPADLRIVGSRSTIAGEARFSLKAMGTQKIPDGAIVYVQSVKAYFQLDKSSTDTPDDVTIVAAALGSGNWYRLGWNSTGPNPWLSQATWYIDAVNGDDEDDGSTAATALASHAEFERRLGQDFLLQIQMTVNILSDLNETIHLRGRVEGVNTVFLRYVGAVKSVLYSGTVNAYQPPSANATPEDGEGQLTDSGVSDWTDVGGENLIGKRVHFTGDNSYTHISNTSILGVDTARVGRPFRFNGGGAGSPYSAATPVATDAFDVEELYAVRGCDVFVTRPWTLAGGLNDGASVIFEGLFWTGLVGTGSSAMIFHGESPQFGGGAGAYVAACSVGPSQLIGSGSGGCRFVACTTIQNSNGGVATLDAAGGLWGVYGQAGGRMNFSHCLVDFITDNSYFDRGNVTFIESARVLKIASFGVYDAPAGANSSAVRVSNSWGRFSENWGNATAEYGFFIEGYAWYGTIPTLSGTVADINLGGNAIAYGALPAKNIPPDSVGGGGTDNNDWHFLLA